MSLNTWAGKEFGPLMSYLDEKRKEIDARAKEAEQKKKQQLARQQKANMLRRKEEAEKARKNEKSKVVIAKQKAKARQQRLRKRMQNTSGFKGKPANPLGRRG